MSKRIFSEEQIKEFLQNPNVERCSKKSITYSNDFKISAVHKYRGGLPPNEIFRQAGFDVYAIGLDVPGDSLLRWRRTFKHKGSEGLATEARGRTGGRSKTSWSNDKEKIKYLETKIAYLKAENDFLAKLRKKSLN
ncbi:MAG: HTH domain-containing protein [Candidatus Paceibacterota bacterium]|jgi:transposase-like protein